MEDDTLGNSTDRTRPRGITAVPAGIRECATEPVFTRRRHESTADTHGVRSPGRADDPCTTPDPLTPGSAVVPGGRWSSTRPPRRKDRAAVRWPRRRTRWP